MDIVNVHYTMHSSSCYNPLEHDDFYLAGNQDGQVQTTNSASLFACGGSNFGSVLKNTFAVCLSQSTIKKKKNEPKISADLYTEVRDPLLWLSLL